MIVVNSGDMPIVLNGLKLRLEKDGFSTEEIILSREGNAEAEYGWPIKELRWELKPSNVATIVAWNSTEQHLFGRYFSPGEYLLYHVV